jgi:hypothetical protein
VHLAPENGEQSLIARPALAFGQRRRSVAATDIPPEDIAVTARTREVTMTLSVCWSAKGGSGTTVVAAALALGSAADSLLLDLDGELPAALGVPEPSGQCLSDWFASDAPERAVLDLSVAVASGTRLVARGPAPIARDSPRWPGLRRFLASSALDVVVDAGCGAPPSALLEGQVRSLLVTRACYLSLTRACRLPRPDGVVLVDEPGRSLTVADVARAVGAPVVARVDVDPAIARAVDAGLLAARLPQGMLKSLQTMRPAATVA